MIPKTENLKSFIGECVQVVDKKLDKILPSENVEPKRLHQAIRHSIFAGGKRFRPVLVFAVGRTFGADLEKLISVASAVEMIHTYSLIHDDLPAMDDDDLRRGRETCHIKFDEATAILAGDALQNMAFQTIAEDKNLAAEKRIELIKEIAKASGTPAGMVAGQQMDLDAEGFENKVSLERLEEIHRSKTGAMICISAKAGAIIADANKTELEAVSNYAECLGLLFQITDDLLDVTQTTEVLGKTAGKDVTANKATYPAFYGIEETRKLAQKVHDDACRELEKIEQNTKILCEIAGYILQRKK
ncbi:MAG: polyprenyl synthetase family protein [Acidobacteriota bacterium]|jgi:geranylgeranyl pyrophosphate synthase|nr:polyprenyl synthetase family protein [Acidobacteriota bacterium]